MIDAFLDTNNFLYACSSAPHEAAKATAARKLVEDTDFGVSVQVLQEFYVNATGKLARTISQERMASVLEQLKKLPVAPVTLELFEASLDLRRRYSLSYWDAAILAAAKELQAKIVYSEDLAHGQEYDGIKVINPFLPISTVD